MPKYMDIKSDAYESIVEALSGSINSANELVYSKAVIENVENIESLDASLIDPEYAGSTLVYGKMQADSVTLNEFISGLDDVNAWTLVPNGTINMRVHPADHPTIDGPGNCFVQYSHQWTNRVGVTYPAKTALYTQDC